MKLLDRLKYSRNPINLLHLSASTGPQSLTSVLSQKFLSRLKKESSRHDNYLNFDCRWNFTTMDLWNSHLPEFGIKQMTSTFQITQGLGNTQDYQNICHIQTLAMDLMKMDVLLISAPMWNYSVPYILKQYMDIAIQPNLVNYVTKSAEKSTEIGRLQDPLCVLISSAGGSIDQRDFLSPIISQSFTLAGFDQFHHISVSNTSLTSKSIAVLDGSQQIDRVLCEIFQEADTPNYGTDQILDC